MSINNNVGGVYQLGTEHFHRRGGEVQYTQLKSGNTAVKTTLSELNSVNVNTF